MQKSIDSRIYHTLLADFMEYQGISDEAEAHRQFKQAELTAKQQWLELRPQTAADKARFYRQADYYIADLTHWLLRDSAVAAFLNMLRQYLSKYQLRTVLDYGCGIGTQGLALAEAGAEVTLMDIEGPVWDYAQWRAKKHGLFDKVRWAPLAPILDEYDLMLCVDVIGHVPDPFRLLDELGDKARYLFYNMDFRIQEKAEDDRYPQHHRKPDKWEGAFRACFKQIDSFLWENIVEEYIR